MGKGGEGVVIDGCIRDSKSALETGLGFGQGFHSQLSYPNRYIPFFRQ